MCVCVCLVQGEGIPPDVVTTTILVKAQVGSGDVDAGARTLIEMMKSSSLKQQLDAFPFNTIIKVCGCFVLRVSSQRRRGLLGILQSDAVLDLCDGV